GPGLAGVRGAALDLVPSSTQKLLEVLHHVIGLLPSPVDKATRDLARVLGRDSALIDGLLEHLVDAVAGEHDHVEGPHQVLAERVAELGDCLCLDARAPRTLGRRARRAACGLSRALLAPPRLPALARRRLARAGRARPTSARRRAPRRRARA